MTRFHVDELKKMTKIKYDPNDDLVSLSLTVIVEQPCHPSQVQGIELAKTEERMYKYLQEKLRNLGGVE